MIDKKKDKKENYHIHTNIHINNTLKGFFLGMVFSVFVIAIFLWYLNNHPFEFKKSIGLSNKSKLINNAYNSSTLNFPDLSKDQNINTNDDNSTIKLEKSKYKNINYSTNDASKFKKEYINTYGIETITNDDIEYLKNINNANNKKYTKNSKQDKVIKNNKINNNKLDKRLNEIIFNKDEIGTIINKINNNENFYQETFQQKINIKNNELDNDYMEDFINNLNNTDKKYTLQIGYFSQKDKATEYASKLSLLKLPVIIKKVIKNNNEYYRIVYQNLSYNKANTIKKLLQKNNISSIIIKD